MLLLLLRMTTFRNQKVQTLDNYYFKWYRKMLLKNLFTLQNMMDLKIKFDLITYAQFS